MSKNKAALIIFVIGLAIGGIFFTEWIDVDYRISVIAVSLWFFGWSARLYFSKASS
jgi:hypothetical protein